MSLTFGPQRLGITITPTTNITVLDRHGNEAVLTEQVSIDNQDMVTFTVAMSGNYRILVDRPEYNDTYTEKVTLSDGPDYDPSDIRSVTDYLLTQVGQGGTPSTMDFVEVTQGDEPRPNVPKVWWQDFREDQTIKPVNMGVKDFWITGGSIPPEPDTEDPTDPSNLQSSNITDTSFTVTWNASTDNVGVTGYNWRINGGSSTSINPTPRTLNFSGRTPETEYTVELQAFDEAGNTSNWVPIVVTTNAATPPSEAFNVFGASAPPGTWGVATGEMPYILTGRGFTSSAVGAEIVGGRIWIPSVMTSVPSEVTFRLHGPNDGIGSAAVRTKVVSLAGITPGSWAEGDFDTPQAMASGEIWMVSAEFSTAGTYVYAADTRPNGDAIISNGPLGDELAWVAYGSGLSTQYKIGTGSATQPGSYDQSYPMDIKVTVPN